MIDLIHQTTEKTFDKVLALLGAYFYSLIESLVHTHLKRYMLRRHRFLQSSAFGASLVSPCVRPGTPADGPEPHAEGLGLVEDIDLAETFRFSTVSLSFPN